jgi:hypothetical protein
MVSAIGDLTPEERLIGAFLSIRDIPYGSANSPSPFAVIERNRGTAKGKHMLLKMVLTSLGYEVKEYWARHDFCKMPVAPWPAVLTPFCNAPLTGFHDFLKVRVGERWVTLDATYDKQLKSLGFPVHEWDGKSDVELPVTAEEVFPVEPPIDEHKRRLVAALPEDMRDRRKHFLKTLKKWLEEERAKMAA